MKSGMSTIEKRLLNFKELCSIIKTCGANNVAELKFGDLCVSFHKKVETQQPIESEHKHNTHTDTEISDEQREQMGKAALEHDEIMTREDQLDQMLIESPSEYERLIAQGDLEDDGQTESVENAETDD